MLSNGGLKRLISRWSQSRQNSCSGRSASVISVVIVPTEYLAQPIANMTRQDRWNMVDERLEKTLEFYGVRIAQLEANQKPPQLS